MLLETNFVSYSLKGSNSSGGFPSFPPPPHSPLQFKEVQSPSVSQSFLHKVWIREKRAWCVCVRAEIKFNSLFLFPTFYLRIPLCAKISRYYTSISSCNSSSFFLLFLSVSDRIPFRGIQKQRKRKWHQCMGEMFCKNVSWNVNARGVELIPTFEMYEEEIPIFSSRTQNACSCSNFNCYVSLSRVTFSARDNSRIVLFCEENNPEIFCRLSFNSRPEQAKEDRDSLSLSYSV